MRNLSALMKADRCRNASAKYSRGTWGFPLKQQNQQRGARCHGLEYGHVLMQVARRTRAHGDGANAVIKGAMKSLLIDRVYRNHLADMVEALP
jgi:hypothetical protein